MALGLMSFVLVLLLTVTALSQVEIRSAEISKQRLLAKENARLGLMIALGNLQKHAGPDQRVTARADAFTGNPQSENAMWTGLMRTDSPTADPLQITWLVSSADETPPDPTAALTSSNSVVLVPEIAGHADEVRAPLRTFDASNSGYAYWVSDESLKASVATRPLLDAQPETWLEDNFGKTWARRLGQIIPKRVGTEMLFPATHGDQATILSELSKVNSFSQFGLTSSWDLSALHEHFHEVTTRSFGVLAATTGTGLKTDLSLAPDLAPISGPFVAVKDFENYMEPPLPEFDSSTPYIPFEEDLRRRFRIQAPTTTTDTEISDGVYPVLADLKLLMHVHVAGSNVVSRTSSSFQPISDPNEVVVRAQMSIELWNPYSSALVPENLVLEIQDLPDITIEFIDSSGASLGTAVVSLNDSLNNGIGRNSGFFTELPFTDRGFPNHDDRSWLPGRLYNWVGPNTYSGGSPKNSPAANFYSRSMSNGILYAPTGIIAPGSTSTIGLSGDAANFSVALRKIAPSGSIISGDELFRIENITYDPFNIPGSIPKNSSGVRFGYQIQRDESGFVALSSDPWDKSRWLRVEDPRSPRPVFDATGLGTGAFQAPNGLDPTGYTSTGVSQADFLFDRVAGASGLRPSEDIPLFELPRHRPLSIGELQHLHIAGERPFSIGNSWGSEADRRYNRIFDEAFFSGLAPADTTPSLAEGEVLPNHRLRPVSQAIGSRKPALADLIDQAEHSSRLLLTEGAFNLNSTSGLAWAAIIGSGLLGEWEVVNINDTNGDLIEGAPTRTVELAQTVLRFPQSAQEVFHTGAYRDTIEPPTEFFRKGAKFFEDPTTNEGDPAPYLDLGQAIAARVSERIRSLGPFPSVESFLSPVELDPFEDPKDPSRYLSVIERAILDVDSINLSDAGEIWHHTSNFLSQADLLTHIAPIAAVRGDTFTIRAAGISEPALNTSAPAQAICEATVQRLPTTVDPGDDDRTPDENGFGRRFIITDLRWISPDEL